MARELTFKIGRKEFSASPTKIDRRKLYGWTELMAVDDEGDQCRLLTTDESGKYIIPLGGTGSGILSGDGQWVERSELQTVDAEGKPARMFPSSFNTVNVLSKKVKPEEFLDYSITDFYELTTATPDLIAAIGDRIYTFEYTYNDSYAPSPAFVMVSGETLFLMIGVKNIYEWLCFGDCENIDETHDDRIVDEGDGDIDFSMF
ncbi:MAG: hypothetical protein LIO77_06215 [Rikenellaceae bacterium]|nr:hypothetical protein [Rikenellaceae bacterium]